MNRIIDDYFIDPNREPDERRQWQCPECGWQARLEYWDVGGADDGYLFCGGCGGEVEAVPLPLPEELERPLVQRALF